MNTDKDKMSKEFGMDMDKLVEFERDVGIVWEWLGKRRPDGVGDDVWRTEPCPLCGADLKYRFSSYNGHAQAICSVDSCINMIQ